MSKKHERISADSVDESEDKVAEALPEEARSKPISSIPDNTHNHYVELDALRGIAILGVFALHATVIWTGATGEPLNVPVLNFDLAKVSALGGGGVMLFFLLSGYLLTWTEERRARNGTYNLRSYALRRAFRLLPAYYVALVLGFLLWPQEKTFLDIVSHLTLMHSFVPDSRVSFDPAFWSLTPEVVFYILLPFLILKLRGFYPRLTLMVVLLTVAVANEFWGYLYTSKGEWLFTYLRHLPTAYLWIFLAGVLLRMMVERMQEEGRAFRFQPHLASLLSVVSAGLLLAIPYVGFPALLKPVGQIIVHSLIAIFFASALLGSPWLLSILRWKNVLAFIGMISYSLFLLHNSVINLVRLYGLPEIKRWFKPWLAEQSDLGVLAVFAGYFGGTLLLAIAVSYLSFRFIESPFLQRKPK